jgi:hypothetical protein
MVLRAPIPGYGLADIDVCKGHTHGKAFYHGLMACGSVWTCPVCAAKVSERRRGELRPAIEAGKALRWVPHFVTFTIRHGIGDDIKELLAKLSDANKRLSNGKYAIKGRIEREYPSEAIHGYIRALEVTHGNKNGFHPHFHMIVFTSEGITSAFLQDAYRVAWQRACRLVGLPIPSDANGVTVQDGRFAAEYASKWGIEDEMTKGHTKQARLKGITPWGMLRAVLDGDDPEYPAERAAALFQVYAAAFAGRRQLYWSNGLRAKLALAKELSDEELVAKPDDEEASVLATLTVEQWKAIRRKGQQAHILTVAESAPGLLHQVVDSLCKAMPVEVIPLLTPDVIPPPVVTPPPVVVSCDAALGRLVSDFDNVRDRLVFEWSNYRNSYLKGVLHGQAIIKKTSDSVFLSSDDGIKGGRGSELFSFFESAGGAKEGSTQLGFSFDSAYALSRG